MTTSDPRLKSVNWTTGMLLSPSHFLLQDESLRDGLAWVLKYTSTGSGLLGAGGRSGAIGKGTAGADPRVDVALEGDLVTVSVSQVQALTPNGQPVSIPSDRTVIGTFPLSDIGEGSGLPVYVLWTGGFDPDVTTAGSDAENPNTPLLRTPNYEVRLSVQPQEVGHSVVVGRIRRDSAQGGLSVDTQFIPKSATLVGHSALYGNCRRVQADVAALANRFTETHRGVCRYISRVAPRGVDVTPDEEIRAFIERAALAVDDCSHEIADPVQPPELFFRSLQKAKRRISLGLELSPATQLFMESLVGADGEYAEVLGSSQGDEVPQEILPGDDLRLHVDRAATMVAGVRRVLEGLEGKYIDYRVNRSVSSLRFLLDRGGDHFYQAITTSSHAQRDGSLLTFVFSDLNLKGKKEYRILLIGAADETPPWQIGESVTATLRINAASHRGSPKTEAVPCEVPGQRNFAVNFITPDNIDAINGIHLTVDPAHTIRSAVLFERRLSQVAPSRPTPSSWSDPARSPSPAPPQPTPTVPAGGRAGGGKAPSKIKIRPRKTEE